MTPPSAYESLPLIRAAVAYVADLDNQDRDQVIDMSQAMLGDVIETDGLAPLAMYVRQFCDVLDNSGPGTAQADAERIAAEITETLRST